MWEYGKRLKKDFTNIYCLQKMNCYIALIRRLALMLQLNIWTNSTQEKICYKNSWKLKKNFNNLSTCFMGILGMSLKCVRVSNVCWPFNVIIINYRVFKDFINNWKKSITVNKGSSLYSSSKTFSLCITWYIES